MRRVCVCVSVRVCVCELLCVCVSNILIYFPLGLNEVVISLKGIHLYLGLPNITLILPWKE